MGNFIDLESEKFFLELIFFLILQDCQTMYSPEKSPSYFSNFMRNHDDACPCKNIRFVGLATSAAFAGVAFYINVVGHPARIQLDNVNALKQWKAMYVRAAPMQV